MRAILVLLITLMGLIPAHGQTAGGVVYAAALSSGEGRTVLALDFDHEPRYQVFFMAEPDRLVIEIRDAVFSFPEGRELVPGGMVAATRHGRITPDRSRFVVTLAGPASVTRKTVNKDEALPRWRLEVELASVTREAFTADLARQRDILGASGGVVVKGDRVVRAEKAKGRFVIVVDPGHGGIDSGAVGLHDTLEKELTLAASLKIAERIRAAGPFDVFLTREDDHFVSLAERQLIARRHQADLMISVHADSLKEKHVRGATIYTLAREASDSLAAQVAESENLADIVAGFSAPDEHDAVTGILADLTLRETTRFSTGFSNALVGSFRGRVPLINNPQRSASFVVLKNAEIPSVLLELGYMSNAEDEKLMIDPKWQETMAGLIARAVAEFFDPRVRALAGN